MDAFSKFLQLYSSKNAEAPETISQFEKFLTTFGIPQQIVHDNGEAFISNNFAHYTNEKGITLCPRNAYSQWTNIKVEVQNKHFTNFLRHFISPIGYICPDYSSKFAFSHNTAVNCSTIITHYGKFLEKTTKTFITRTVRTTTRLRKDKSASQNCSNLQ